MPNIKKILESQRKFYVSGYTLEMFFRITQLQNLRASLQVHEAEILTALSWSGQLQYIFSSKEHDQTITEI